MASDIDPKVRAIYYLMLGKIRWIIDPSNNPEQRYLWLGDSEASTVIINNSDDRAVPNEKLICAKQILDSITD